MKYLVTARPGTTTIRLKHGAQLFQAAKEWVNARLAEGTFDCHHAFVDLDGVSIANADTPEAAYDMGLDYPLYPFFEWTVEPIFDWQYAYDKNIAYFRKFGK